MKLVFVALFSLLPIFIFCQNTKSPYTKREGTSCYEMAACKGKKLVFAMDTKKTGNIKKCKLILNEGNRKGIVKFYKKKVIRKLHFDQKQNPLPASGKVCFCISRGAHTDPK